MGPNEQPQGAIAGDYLVSVSKKEELIIPAGLSNTETMEFLRTAKKPKSLLPVKFSDPAGSGLKAVVETKKGATLDLKLTD